MTAKLMPLFFRRVTGARDWSAAEVAEFYRVEAALVQAGVVPVETERGLSDEGEPWFAFCRADTGEVIVHIARIGANYVLAGPAFGGIAQGKDVHLMIADLLSRHPTVICDFCSLRT